MKNIDNIVSDFMDAIDPTRKMKVIVTGPNNSHYLLITIQWEYRTMTIEVLQTRSGEFINPAQLNLFGFTHAEGDRMMERFVNLL